LPVPQLLRWLAWAGLVGSTLFDGGCVTTGPIEYIHNGLKVGPNYARPPAPVAEDWIEADDPNVQKRNLEDWWGVFNDPTLNSLIGTAYDQNLTLRVVGTRVLQARAQQAIAAGSIFPQVQQASVEYSRVGLSHTTFNNPSDLTAAAHATPPPGALIGNFFSDWTAGFNLSWELDFWGRFRRAIESANASLDSSVENYDAALVTLLADVATNYVQYRVAQQRIKIALDNIKEQEGLVELVKNRSKVGTATEIDLQQLQTLLEQTRATVPGLRITLGQANDALCTLLGVPPRDLGPELGPGPALESEPLPNTPTWVAAGIPADLLRRRPDVRSAERQVAAQSALIGVAEAELYPTIFINGTIGYDAAELSKLFESKSFMGNITPNFKWNILNYGRIANNVHLQQAKTQELIAAYQNQVLIAAQQVQTALRGFLESWEQARVLRDCVTAATKAWVAGRIEFREIEKRVDVNRLFTLESTKLQRQDDLAVAQGNIALNLINVYRALGGGWEFRCRPQGRKPSAGGGALAEEAPRPTPVREVLPPPMPIP
jgi:NodT family efflux transporter outer membrane factor (OMF) lipoprotein